MRTQEEQGALGEHLVQDGLKDLNSEYRAIHDLVISTPDGRTTQIDHVVASPYGVFVIETKKYRGTIIAAQNNATWFQLLGTCLSPFFSPVKQNEYHIESLKTQVGLPKIVFRSVVVFVGTPRLLSPEPIEGVVTTIAPGVPGLIRHLKTFRTRVLTDAQLQIAFERLADLKRSGPSSADHAQRMRAAQWTRLSSIAPEPSNHPIRAL